MTPPTLFCQNIVFLIFLFHQSASLWSSLHLTPGLSASPPCQRGAPLIYLHQKSKSSFQQKRSIQKSIVVLENRQIRNRKCLHITQIEKIPGALTRTSPSYPSLWCPLVGKPSSRPASPSSTMPPRWIFQCLRSFQGSMNFPRFTTYATEGICNSSHLTRTFITYSTYM